MRKKSILLISSGIIHPPLLGVRRLHSLVKTSASRMWMLPSMEDLPGLDLVDIAAIVLYIHHKVISEEALSTFNRYVAGGGGVLAIHSATASFKTNPGYFEILGGRFTSHGKIMPFEVKPVKSSSEPFAGIGRFRIRDEIYLHEIQPGIRVHFETHYQGEPIPVVWTYHHGAGRICYAMPGHGTGTMKNPAYQEILIRGLDWVSNSL